MNETAKATSLAAEFLRAQFDLLIGNVRASTLPTLLVGAMLAAFYAFFFARYEGFIWWLCLLAVSAVRWPLLTIDADTDIAPRLSKLLLLMIVVGLLWGLAPLWYAYALGVEAAFAAVLLAAGIAIAAFGSYGIDARAAAAVALPIGLAIVGVCVLSGQTALYAVAAALPLLYVHQFFIMRQGRQLLHKQIRLRLENNALIEELSERSEKTTAELDRRIESERMLRASRDRAERLSATDGLTGIANRRYFDKRLQSEVSRAFRERTTLSLVICDIDFFKQFNDTYGHQEGDNCIKAFARVLESYCRRGGDLPARIGGEEFALLLPTTTLDAAKNLAEQARAAFDELAIAHTGSPAKKNATASFGVSCSVPAALDAGEALMRAADEALYSAKESGRNRVVARAEPDASPNPALN